MQVRWQSQRQAAIRYSGHCQVHQNPFSLLLPCAPTSLDCILSLNCDAAPFADQPGQMQPGHHFSDDVDMPPEQGSSDVLAFKVKFGDTHLQLLQHLHEQQPPEFEEGQQAIKSYICLFAGELHDFLLPQQQHMGLLLCRLH